MMRTQMMMMMTIMIILIMMTRQDIRDTNNSVSQAYS